MKPLLLLLLLTSWTHLGSEARICGTGLEINDHLISIDGSRMAGADAYFMKAYNCDKLETCLEDCCSSKFGTCSVAAFKNKSESTCLHFFCEPLSKCKFFSTDFADSFAFPHPTTSTPHTKLEELVTPITDIVNLLKDYERSVAARKGVENIQLTRKGVDLTGESHVLHGELIFRENDTTTTIKPQQEVGAVKEDHVLDGDLVFKDGNTTIKLQHEIGVIQNLDDELTFKDDNTTIKPRKGVDFFSYIATTPLSNVSVIKPRKGVDMNDVGIHDTRSKIKPRKGVEPFTPTATSAMPSSSIHIFTNGTSILQHDIYLHANDELLSILEDIFSDDTNATELATEVPESFTTARAPIVQVSSSAPTVQISSSTPSFMTSATLHTHDKSFSIIPTSVNSSPSAVPHAPLIVDYDDKMDSRIPYHISTSTPRLYSSISHDQSTHQYSSILSTSTLDSTSIRKVIPSTVNTKFHILSSSPVVIQNSLHSSSILSKEILKADQEDQKAKEESERKYQSSMHLVFALVFGLLVLFGVFGTIAKKVYDSWVRRHYRRMDFLIDGMYDGYP